MIALPDWCGEVSHVMSFGYVVCTLFKGHEGSHLAITAQEVGKNVRVFRVDWGKEAEGHVPAP